MDFSKVVDELAGFLGRDGVNDPGRTLQEMADIRFLLQIDGVDEREIERYFENAGLKEKFDGIKRSI